MTSSQQPSIVSGPVPLLWADGEAPSSVSRSLPPVEPDDRAGVFGPFEDIDLVSIPPLEPIAAEPRLVMACDGGIGALNITALPEEGWDVGMRAYTSFRDKLSDRHGGDEDEDCEEQRHEENAFHDDRLLCALSDGCLGVDTGVSVHAMLWVDEEISTSRDTASGLEEFVLVGSVKAVVFQTNPGASRVLFRKGTWLEVSLCLPKGIATNTDASSWTFLTSDGAENELPDRDRVVIRFPMWQGRADHARDNGKGARGRAERPNNRNDGVRRQDDQRRVEVRRNYPLTDHRKKMVMEYELRLIKDVHREELRVVDSLLPRVMGIRPYAYTCKSTDTKPCEGEEGNGSAGRATNQLLAIFEVEGSWDDPSRYATYPRLSASMNGRPWTRNSVRIGDGRGASLDPGWVVSISNKQFRVDGVQVRGDTGPGGGKKAVCKRKTAAVVPLSSSPPSAQPSFSPRGLMPAGGGILVPGSPRGSAKTGAHVEGASVPPDPRSPRTAAPPSSFSARVEWEVKDYDDKKDLRSDTTEITMTLCKPTDRIMSKEGVLRPSSVCLAFYGEDNARRCIYDQQNGAGLVLRTRYSIGLSKNVLRVVTRNSLSPASLG